LFAASAKRGSREWFNSKLKLIAHDCGDEVRDLARSAWADIVHDEPAQAAHDGVRALDMIHKVGKLAKDLRDPLAKRAIQKPLFDADIPALEKIEAVIDSDEIANLVHWQKKDEDAIAKTAQHWFDLESRIDGRNARTELSIRRSIRREMKQSTAKINTLLGLVGANSNKICTPHEIEIRNGQKARWREFGKKTVLRRGDEEVSMLDVMKAAGKKKLAEVYTLTKGLEAYAKAAGLTWAFVTLTAPPRMHSNPSHGKNTWDGTTPVEAHKWIREQWHGAEARLRKLGIVISGLRVVEPHQDGTPHWHALVFAHPEEMGTIEAELRSCAPEWAAEAGLKFVTNNGKASAATYCFKYVLKTIGNVEKLDGELGAVDAWRSTWGIRSFQWFGMPSVALWRSLRAVKEAPTDPDVAGMWHAAKRGDAHAFIGLAGGLNVKKKARPVSVTQRSDEHEKQFLFFVRKTSDCFCVSIKKWKREASRKASTGGELKLFQIVQEGQNPTPKPTEKTWATTEPRAGPVQNHPKNNENTTDQRALN
jgi:hypothetical protein